MSTSIEQQQQQQPPPPLEAIQEAYTAHSGHGSVGPFIGVLAVITILGAIAVVIGRLCSGRRIMGHGRYDFEGWVETKCASCIDGRVDHPRPPAEREGAESTTSSGRVSGEDAVPGAVSAEAPCQAEEQITQQHPQRNAAET